MPDFSVSKRLFSFVIALLCFSIIVVFMEEYAGDGLSSDGTSSDDCWKHEQVVVLDSCVRCSDFETRALKAKHCVATGFFDRVNCTDSGTVALRPCDRKPDADVTTFHLFAFLNFVLIPVSYLVTRKRMTEANQLAYTRVAQFFEPA
ncbi:unnamed protein product [Heligmosomoides polygyrus]|uniref:Protein JTB n=1 Tax=Heligmosomoides polygyrus TaxID=6339 RepID=A0A183GM88_HELPZ|nr:unnamed protein product [Heligmosomoides polygyrus]